MAHNHVTRKRLATNVGCSQNASGLNFHHIGGNSRCNRLPAALHRTKGGNSAALNTGHDAQELTASISLAMEFHHEMGIDSQ